MGQFKSTGFFRAMFSISFVILLFTNVNAQSRLTIEAVEEALDPPKTRNLRPLLDLTVNFDFDSASIQEESKPDLRVIGVALARERLLSYKFRIEGHTDAKGSALYNQRLSERRADAVVEFLVNQGVKRERLTAIGKGFSDLLEPDHPTAAKNRRVRVLTIRE